MVGGARDTGVVLRELFATAERRVLIIGFAVHQGREVFAVLAERMRQIPDLMVCRCIDVRRARRRDAGRCDCSPFLPSASWLTNGRDRGCPRYSRTSVASPPAKAREPAFTPSVSLSTASRPLLDRQT